MRLPLNTLTGLALLCALGMSVPAALGTESFEQAKHGKFTTLSTKYGPMSCRDGVAEIGGGGKSGKSSLRMFGGQDTELKLDLKNTPSGKYGCPPGRSAGPDRPPLNFPLWP